MTKPFDIVLVSCTARKRTSTAPAKELYVSDWFVKARQVAEEYGRQWFVLSAKHHLLAPDAATEPYDLSLEEFSTAERERWAQAVWDELGERFPRTEGMSVLVLAGHNYRKHLVRHLESHGMAVSAPLSDLGIGRQLKYLGDIAGLSEQAQLQRRFYAQLDRLRRADGSFMRLADLRPSDVPARGVYFFLEDGEGCRLWPGQHRVVRIGTHAVSQGSKSTLWQRLRAHRGLDKGGGSHRSSIFRLHVGNCLRVRDAIGPESWAIGESADRATREAEAHLEGLVSDYIGNLRVALLPILDEASPDSDRSFIEMNAIGLLTHRSSIDTPSASWLGNLSPVREIRESGLWNINYVGCDFHYQFLEVFERSIDRSIGGGKAEPPSIAPLAWRQDQSSVRQINLFE